MRNLWELILQIFLNSPEMKTFHPLLVVLVENDEEDGLLSSKLRTQRERECSNGSVSIQFLAFIGMILGE